MNNMLAFVSSVLTDIPAFLASEPIIYIVAFGLFGYVLNLVVRIFRP